MGSHGRGSSPAPGGLPARGLPTSTITVGGPPPAAAGAPVTGSDSGPASCPSVTAATA